jgi:hypothetical protein
VRALWSASIVLASLAVGCGGDPKPAPATTAPARARPASPDEVRCGELQTRASAHRLARKLVDRVVAPEHQRERETIGIIGESLYATCRQQRLPGVKKAADYRPVKPVLAAIQRDFDEEEITGG